MEGAKIHPGFPSQRVLAQITSCWKLDLLVWARESQWASAACPLFWAGPRCAGSSCHRLEGRPESRERISVSGIGWPGFESAAE